MRKSAALVCAAALGAALAFPYVPASADDARAEDVAAIRACLGTNRLPAERRPCIGRVSDPCMKQPGGDSTVGMRQCYDREARAWDTLLNQTYVRVLKSFDADGKTYIKDAQTAWIRFRDLSCDWPGKVFPTGTIQGPLAIECFRDATAERAITMMEIDEFQHPD